MFGDKDWGATYLMQFLSVDPDVLDVLQAQAPQVPHVGGPRMPGVDAWRREHRQISKRQRSVGSQESENPREHVARRLEYDPPLPPPAHPPGLSPPTVAPAADKDEIMEAEPEDDGLHDP